MNSPTDTDEASLIIQTLRYVADLWVMSEACAKNARQERARSLKTAGGRPRTKYSGPRFAKLHAVIQPRMGTPSEDIRETGRFKNLTMM